MLIGCSISMIVGLVIGVIVYLPSIARNREGQAHASIALYLLSYLFWGTSFFSCVLSFRLTKQRKACGCSCSWIYVMGIMEMMGVIAGFVTGLTIDLSINYGYYYNYYYSNGPSFMLLIGMPTSLASILVFGTVRVILTGREGRQHAKKDDDVHHDTPHHHDFSDASRSQPIPRHPHDAAGTPLVSATSPLVRDIPAPAGPPGYNAAVNVGYQQINPPPFAVNYAGQNQYPK